jgi:hypothetical protein
MHAKWCKISRGEFPLVRRNAPLVLACDRTYTAKLGLSLSPGCQINRLQDLAKGQESAISKWSETPISSFRFSETKSAHLKLSIVAFVYRRVPLWRHLRLKLNSTS